MSDFIVVGITIWSCVGIVLFAMVMDKIDPTSYKEHWPTQKRLIWFSILCGPISFVFFWHIL